MKSSSKILVIEFDHDTRVAYRKALEEDGYVVVSTANGKNGIDLLEREYSKTRLIILCLNMPIMDGNAFLKARSEDPRFRDIPVVVIAQSPEILHYPVAETIQKPISKAQLLKVATKYF